LRSPTRASLSSELQSQDVDRTSVPLSSVPKSGTAKLAGTGSIPNHKSVLPLPVFI
jgi:hypothetical protein